MEKRSSHNDFATSHELKERRFTGIRHNSITDEQELWIEGHVAIAMPISVVLHNPQAWHKKYEEYFMLHNVEEKGD